MKYKVTPKPRYNIIYCVECASNLATYKYQDNYYCGDCVLDKIVSEKGIHKVTRYYTLDDIKFERGFDSITALKVLEDKNVIKEI